MNRKKTAAVTYSNQNEILPLSEEGLLYVSYKHDRISPDLHGQAYTITIRIDPSGKVTVIERIGRGAAINRRHYEVIPEKVSGFFGEAVECINDRCSYDDIFVDDCSGILTLHYKDRNILADRGTYNSCKDVHLETIVSRFFEENGIEWRLSEKGWQQYLEMVKQGTD